MCFGLGQIHARSVSCRFHSMIEDLTTKTQEFTATSARLTEISRLLIACMFVEQIVWCSCIILDLLSIAAIFALVLVLYCIWSSVGARLILNIFRI